MVHKLLQLVFAITILLLPTWLYADGFPIKNGRYAGGAVVLVELTTPQANLIHRQFKSGMVIRLSESQQAKIKLEAKLKIAPTKIEIYHASDLANDCTCFSANLGFDFKPRWIEVTVCFLCSDKEAESQKPDPNG